MNGNGLVYKDELDEPFEHSILSLAKGVASIYNDIKLS